MVRLRIDVINLEFQEPECLDVEAVHKYKQAALSGQALPAVHCYWDGHTYRLFDGFHRIAALRVLGIAEVDAEITDGTREDMEARFREGLALIREDLRKAAGE